MENRLKTALDYVSYTQLRLIIARLHLRQRASTTPRSASSIALCTAAPTTEPHHNRQREYWWYEFTINFVILLSHQPVPTPTHLQSILLPDEQTL